MKTKSIALSVAALAVAVTPVMASAVNPTNTTVTATVGSTISMTGSTAVALALTPSGSSVQSVNSGTYTVSTNATTGYTLAIKDSDATLNLTSGTDTIVPGTGTAAAPVALADGQWGWARAGAPFSATYTVANNTPGVAATFAGITASDATVKTTATTASDDNTVVYYSARVGTAQATGSYTDTVVVTATANN